MQTKETTAVEYTSKLKPTLPQLQRQRNYKTAPKMKILEVTKT